MFFFERTKGVISVFLIMVMLPIFTSAVLLVDGARYQSAKMLVQEAGDLAAYSVTTKYNQELKDAYGLFAINEKNISAEFERYFKENLGCSEAESKDYSEKVQGLLTNLIGGSEYKNEKFYDLYNFNVNEPVAKGIYPLSNPGVLQNQIVDYTKYRGIETILERFEIINKFQDFKNLLDGNSKTMEAIEELAKVDEDYGAKVMGDIMNLLKAKEDYDEALSNLTEQLEKYESAYKNELCYMAINKKNLVDNYDSNRKEYAKEISKYLSLTEDDGIVKRYSEMKGLCQVVIDEAEAAIAKYEELRTKYNEQEDIKADIEKEIEILRKVISSDEKDAKCSVVLFDRDTNYQVDSDSVGELNKVFSEMENNMNNAVSAYNTAYKQTQEANPSMSDEEIIAENCYSFYYSNIEWPGTKDQKYVWESEVPDEVSKYADEVVKSYYNLAEKFEKKKQYWITGELENAYDGSNTGDETDKKKVDEATEKANSAAKSNDEEKEKPEYKKIDDDTYNSLPSKDKGAMEEKEIAELDKENPSEMMNSAKNAGSEFMKFLEAGRNDVLTFCYILDMFKTRNSIKDFSGKTQNQWYSTKWRYADDKGEVDLRYRRKDNGLSTYFYTGEVEYIFGGNKSEATNNTIVYSWIYGTRLANNIVTVYTDKTAKAECEALALAASAACSALIPIPAAVFKWVFIAAWAAGETALEMNYLIDDGYRIPLIKTKLFIKSFENVLSVGEENREELIKNCDSSLVDVCYEDYLLLLMCFVDRNTRLLRVADLIQLNMQTRGQTDFKMSEANTYIMAETTVSAKYLFQPVKQFTDSYTGTGFTLKNKIYQGY